jgi:hypothetical protein
VPVTADLYESEYDPDPRDRTRIHFESYTIARTIARDALEDEGCAAVKTTQNNPLGRVRCLSPCAVEGDVG